jgi:BirA family biotin operon repressor/biotin-[acetyl-CoA-carboxylase] ligase
LEIIYLEEVDSTNSYAISLAEEGYPEGTVVVADAQTKGRGRLGRIWYSPPGKNLYLSIIIRPSIILKELPLLTLMAATATAEAIREETTIPVSIKWPNDLMVPFNDGYRKVGGILSEARLSAGKVEFAIIGIGLNVNTLIDDLSLEIIDSAASLRMVSEGEIDRIRLLNHILKRFDHYYRRLLNGDRKRVVDRCRGLSLTPGRDVVVFTGQERLVGMAEEIDDEGHLIVRMPDGMVRRINSADIIHLR